MVWGRWIFALGGNPEAARRAAIPVPWVYVSVYALSGLLAGIAAVLASGRSNGGSPNFGQLAELDSIAAVVIGGASFLGGRGNIGNALIGALMIGIIRNGMNLLNIDAFMQLVVIGLVIAAAVEGKYRILCLKRPLADVASDLKLTKDALLEKLEPIKKKLFAAREAAAPFLDTKVLTAWNGQMIAGYAVAGPVLGEPKYVDGRAKAADFVLKKLRTKDGRLLRTYGAPRRSKAEARLNGYLDDYAYLVHGLLCLHDATNDKKWLDEAKAADRDDGEAPRRRQGGRLLLHLARPREAVRPRQGPVRRRPAVRQQRGGPQPRAAVAEDGRRAVPQAGREDVRGRWACP